MFLPAVLFIVLEFSHKMLGGTRSLIYIIKNMKKLQLHVLCLNSGEFYETLISSGVQTTLMNLGNRDLFSNFRNKNFKCQVQLLMRLIISNIRTFCFVRKQRARIIHCNSIYDFLYSFMGIKLARGKIVFNIRATHPQDKMKWHWQIALLISSAIIVLSQEMKQYYVDRTWRFYRKWVEKKIRAIYSGIPFDEVDKYNIQCRKYYRESLGLPQEACIIAYVGSIIPRKMQLEAIKRIVLPITHKESHVLFCFIGGVIESDPESIPYLATCLRTVEELRLERFVRFVGHQSEIYPWFIAADFSALASTFEGLPRVLIESLACYRPVVSTAVTSAREILEKYNCGFVANHSDWEAITDSILQLCQDTPLRAQMSKRAGEMARHLFDLDAVTSQYEELYLELAKR